MRTASAILISVCLCAGSWAADNLLSNPDFAAAMDGWVVADGSGWEAVADAGPEARPALAFTGGSGEAVRQTVQFVTPGVAHRLSANLYSDGTLQPTVRVIEVLTGEALATITAQATEGWQALWQEFTPGSADLRLEIYPHPSTIEGLACPAGEARVTDIVLRQTGAAAGMELPDMGENIALGRPYTLEPKPGYSFCTDPGDVTQLTDGEFSEGYFWTQPSTVGWSGVSPRIVTIDLGQDQPIRAISLNTAAGAAGVTWPQSILIFTSLDGQRWHEVGDLVRMHTQREPLPERDLYAVRRIWADDLDTHGAYVKLVIQPDGPYTFSDEIEVFHGDTALLAQALPGEGLVDIAQIMEMRQVLGLIQAQFRRDLNPIGDDIRALPQGRRQQFEVRAQQLADAIEAMEPIPMEGFVAILPMTELERDIFRLQADVWRAQGKDDVRLWDMNRWDPLAPNQEPGPGEDGAAVEVSMMQNEYRADVFNITNASERDLRLRLSVVGVPGAPDPDWLSVHEVEHVGTRWFTSVAAALPLADRAGSDWLITVPSGMTRQVWVAINKPQIDAGTYSGAIELRSVGGFAASVPLRLRIYPLRFPDETTINCGGWTYADANTYGVTPENRDELIAHLKEHYVNAPWATGSTIMGGSFDDEGNVLTAPDTTRFDDWVALWPDAKNYLVFAAVGASFDGAQMGTQVFANKVGAWARFWSDHMEALGKRPDQLGLLLVDEPHSQEQYETIVAWARAVKTTAPDLVIWEDPQPPDPEPWVLEMFELADVLCPLRSQYITKPAWYRETLADYQADGKELWFYSANGPARTFDPFSYYLLQAWHAFKIGAKGTNFWAFGDNGGVSCWNEYPAAGNGPYCPTYIDATSVTPAKYMEAIREGIEDYEYLTMLLARNRELVEAGAPDSQTDPALDLLQNGPDRVMAMEQDAQWTWDLEKDRSVQDQVRIELLEALVESQGW